MPQRPRHGISRSGQITHFHYEQRRTIMSNTQPTASRRGLSLDWYAVALALLAALLVRLNLIPPVKW